MLKNFHLTVWGIVIFFLIIMGGVVTIAFTRESNSTGVDPALISKIREQ